MLFVIFSSLVFNIFDSMRIWLRTTWFYFILLALVGLLLRVFPFASLSEYFSYRNLVHAHSHIAILGWVYNSLFLLFYHSFLKGNIGPRRKTFSFLIKLYQVVLLLMFVAFVYQGYGLYSILFSSLQMLISFLLLYQVYKSNAQLNLAAHFSSVFLILSSVLPLFLGMVKALKVEGATAELIINNYLYFQISGFVYFALIAVVSKHFLFRTNEAYKKWLGLLFISVVALAMIAMKWVDTWLCKFLIVLFSSLQILALWKIFNNYIREYAFVRYLFWVFISKAAIQYVFIFPDSLFWLSNRFMIISYLHYLLLFVFSFSFYLLFVLFGWIRKSGSLIAIYLIATFGTVGLLLFLGFGVSLSLYRELLLLFSALLFIAISATKITLKN